MYSGGTVSVRPKLVMGVTQGVWGELTEAGEMG